MAEKENINIIQLFDNQVRDRNQKLFTSNFCDESLRNDVGQSFQNINEENTPESLLFQSFIENGCDLEILSNEDLHSHLNQNSEIDFEAVKYIANENETSTVIPNNSQTNYDCVSRLFHYEAPSVIDSSGETLPLVPQDSIKIKNVDPQRDICGQLYSTTRALERHKKIIHEKLAPYKCDKYDEEFSQKDTLTKHLAVDSVTGAVKCSTSNYYNSETEVSNYERKAVEVWKPFPAPANNPCERPEIGNPLQTFSCDICSQDYQNKSSLIRHKRARHDTEKRFVCPTCGKEFGAKSDLTQHMIAHSTVRPFKCTICGNAYKYKKNLRDHEITKHIRTSHVRGKRFVCPTCGKGFGLKCHLSKHLTAHSTDRPFKCTICGNAYKRKYGLKDHMITTHGAASRFSCENCGKNFPCKERLIFHAQKHHHHESEKPFPCKICGKSFAFNSRLRVHQLVHMSKRPFQCPKCDLRFKSEDRRRTHVRMVHEAHDKFYCPHCNKSYRYKGNLSAHIRSHHLYPDKT